MKFSNMSVEDALQLEEQFAEEAIQLRSLRKELSRKIGSYNDRNDGFARSAFSRSKANYSRSRKIGKINKKRIRQQLAEQLAMTT